MALRLYYEEPGIQLWCGANQEMLAELDPASIDLLLTDPPYGVNTPVDNRRFSGKGRLTGARTFGARTCVSARRPVYGDCEPFDPTPLLRFPRLVLFGANHFASRLPDSGGWIVWDKRKGLEDMQNWPFSEAELAWTNLSGTVRMYRNRWMGLVRDSELGEHYHPTQKPVALMRWILERWTKQGDLILDPYCGSGPVLRAAKDLGRRAIGVEIYLEYCDVVIKRLQQGVLALDSLDAAEA